MRSLASEPRSQLTLDFESTLSERYRSLREYIAYRVQVQSKPAKSLAADMDMSPSTLSRKLSPGDGDTQRFNCDDLENYIAASGDTTAIDYLASKYLHSDANRRERAIARVEALAIDLDRTLRDLRGAQ